MRAWPPEIAAFRRSWRLRCGRMELSSSAANPAAPNSALSRSRRLLHIEHHTPQAEGAEDGVVDRDGPAVVLQFVHTQAEAVLRDEGGFAAGGFDGGGEAFAGLPEGELSSTSWRCTRRGCRKVMHSVHRRFSQRAT